MEQKITLTQALDIFSDNLNEINEAVQSNMLDGLKKINKHPITNNEIKDMLWHDIYQLRVKEVTKQPLRIIKRIKSRLAPPRPGAITDNDIQNARDYDIKELFTEQVGTHIHHGMCRCPFHTDNTASMSLRKYNRFRCFSCDERGDTIALYMKLNDVNFIQAVKALI